MRRMQAIFTNASAVEGGDLVGLGEPARLTQPGRGSLHNPALGQRLKNMPLAALDYPHVPARRAQRQLIRLPVFRGNQGARTAAPAKPWFLPGLSCPGRCAPGTSSLAHFSKVVWPALVSGEGFEQVLRPVGPGNPANGIRLKTTPPGPGASMILPTPPVHQRHAQHGHRAARGQGNMHRLAQP